MQQTEKIFLSIIPEKVSSELEIINDFSRDEFLRGTTSIGYLNPYDHSFSYQ